MSSDPANLPELDLTILNPVREVLEGPMFGHMIEVLETSAREILADLDRTLAAGEHHQAGRLAHKLKGSSANVGLARVSAACAAIEASADLAAAKAHFAQLPGLFEAGLAALKIAAAKPPA